jgi:hypothetical protein
MKSLTVTFCAFFLDVAFRIFFRKSIFSINICFKFSDALTYNTFGRIIGHILTKITNCLITYGQLSGRLTICITKTVFQFLTGKNTLIQYVVYNHEKNQKKSNYGAHSQCISEPYQVAHIFY